jgi:hypothetical protein
MSSNKPLDHPGSEGVGIVPEGTTLTNLRPGIHENTGRGAMIQDGSDGRTWAQFNSGRYSLGWWPYPKKEFVNGD